MDRNNSGINRILEETAALIRRGKETTRYVEQTKSSKREQIERLKEFATNNNLLIDLKKSHLVFLSKGGEIPKLDSDNFIYPQKKAQKRPLLSPVFFSALVLRRGSAA